MNVLIKLDTTVNKLPEDTNEYYTDHVDLNKKLTHKSNNLAEIISPE